MLHQCVNLIFDIPQNPSSFLLLTFLNQELAEQSEILETVGDQDPSQFYYGQVKFPHDFLADTPKTRGSGITFTSKWSNFIDVSYKTRIVVITDSSN